MELSELTNIKVQEYKPYINIEKVLNTTFTILDYKVTTRKKGHFLTMVVECPVFLTWKQKLKHYWYHVLHIPYEDTQLRIIAGYYSKLIDFLQNCERCYSKEQMLPINRAIIEKRVGYYFKNTYSI